ncbi:MAG: hypothetical protein NT120_04545, partial [Candidatus Aenigmarchaeota archaeon]|nr:hypothetical protein [Candidatus Aenigmarchaeota archaeon]
MADDVNSGAPLSNKIEKLNLAFKLENINADLIDAQSNINGVINLYRQQNQPISMLEDSIKEIENAKNEIKNLKSLLANTEDVSSINETVTNSIKNIRISVVSALKNIMGLDGSEINRINYVPGQVIVKLRSGCTPSQVQQEVLPISLVSTNAMTGELLASADYTQAITQGIQQESLQTMVSNPDSFDRANGLDRVYTLDSSSLQQKGQQYLETEAIIDNTVQTYEIDTATGKETINSLNPIDPYTLGLYSKYKNQPCVEEVGLIPVMRLADANYNTDVTGPAANPIQAVKSKSYPVDNFFSSLAGSIISRLNSITGMAANKITGMAQATGSCSGTPQAIVICSMFDSYNCGKVSRCQYNGEQTNCEDKRGSQQDLTCSEIGKDLCMNYVGCYVACGSDSNCPSNSICNPANSRCESYLDLSPGNSPIKEKVFDQSGQKIKLKSKVYDFDLRTKDSMGRDANGFSITLSGDNMIFDCNGATLNMKYSSYISGSYENSLSPWGSIIKSTGNNNEIKNCKFVVKPADSLSLQPAAIITSGTTKINGNTFDLQSSTFGLVADASADVSGNTFTGTQKTSGFSGTAILINTASGSTTIHENNFLNN